VCVLRRCRPCHASEGRSKKREWWLLNDSSVRSVSERDVLMSNAYILFYERKGDHERAADQRKAHPSPPTSVGRYGLAPEQAAEGGGAAPSTAFIGPAPRPSPAQSALASASYSASCVGNGALSPAQAPANGNGPAREENGASSSGGGWGGWQKRTKLEHGATGMNGHGRTENGHSENGRPRGHGIETPQRPTVASAEPSSATPLGGRGHQRPEVMNGGRGGDGGGHVVPSSGIVTLGTAVSPAAQKRKREELREGIVDGALAHVSPVELRAELRELLATSTSRVEQALRAAAVDDWHKLFSAFVADRPAPPTQDQLVHEFEGRLDMKGVTSALERQGLHVGKLLVELMHQVDR